MLADLPKGRENFFLSPLHGIIPATFENAENGRKRTGNFFDFLFCIFTNGRYCSCFFVAIGADNTLPVSRK